MTGRRLCSGLVAHSRGRRCGAKVGHKTGPRVVRAAVAVVGSCRSRLGGSLAGRVGRVSRFVRSFHEVKGTLAAAQAGRDRGRRGVAWPTQEAKPRESLEVAASSADAGVVASADLPPCQWHECGVRLLVCLWVCAFDGDG